MKHRNDEKIAREIRRLTAERGRDKSACPSEVARLLDSDGWRDLMPRVRAMAATLADRGEILVTRKGEPVDAEDAGGPIRLSMADSHPDAS